MLKKSEVEHVAKLARIKLSSEEIKLMQKDLSSILDYVEKLKELNVEKIPPTTHSTGIRNITRKDIASKQDLKQSKKLIDLAPEKKERFIKIKSVF
jgi:aspartyl-tRNA(Asn)/glutamyl-tRNA(Gln) amidotransferase subunit C